MAQLAAIVIPKLLAWFVGQHRLGQEIGELHERLLTTGAVF